MPLATGVNYRCRSFFMSARIRLKVITAYVCVCIGVSHRKTRNQTITGPIAPRVCARVRVRVRVRVCVLERIPCALLVVDC